MISGFHGRPMMGLRPLPGEDYMDTIGDVPWLLNHVSKVWMTYCNFVFYVCTFLLIKQHFSDVTWLTGLARKTSSKIDLTDLT